MRRFASLRRIYSSLLILGFLTMMAGTAEWLIWVNADRYPHWLAHGYPGC
ncbi:hypothetical protein [Scandinavium sp.]|nr:hypothetical protein [Scandinavium sp.]